MQKTTAKVEHSDYVPYWWIAIEFCYVDFYGFRAEEMRKKWRDIKHKRYVKYDSIYKANEIKIKNLHDQINDIQGKKESLTNSKPIKPFYRLWYNKEEKEKISQINKLLDESSKKADRLTFEANKLTRENKKVKDKKSFEVHECHRKIENLLEQNGFVLTHTSSQGEECVTKTEVWTLEE